jgi:hypothetical protein
MRRIETKTIRAQLQQQLNKLLTLMKEELEEVIECLWYLLEEGEVGEEEVEEAVVVAVEQVQSEVLLVKVQKLLIIVEDQINNKDVQHLH